jgi:tRNA-specific 2-thiouridylase
MSGGVDSSLAAALMREAGHEVVGITLKLWPCAEDDGGFTRPDACCSPSETIDARASALKSGVAHFTVDAEDDFRRDVVEPFVAGWMRGETPNPCIRCNESIKFGTLWRRAQDLGAERVATGHYARTGRAFDRWLLRRSVDTAKDQCYFLFSLTQEQLAAAEFPVGHLTKDQVRAAAAARALPTATKRESQDICFTGADGSEGFLRAAAPAAFAPGPILLADDGRVMGEHRGLCGYTVGQRHGLGVAWSEPLFVTAIDRARNAVVVGPRRALMTTMARLRDCTWHLGDLPAAGLDCLLRTRHRARPVRATIMADGDGALVTYAEPHTRSNAGQACVAYSLDDDWCLGGGWFVSP